MTREEISKRSLEGFLEVYEHFRPLCKIHLICYIYLIVISKLEEDELEDSNPSHPTVETVSALSQKFSKMIAQMELKVNSLAASR